VRSMNNLGDLQSGTTANAKSHCDAKATPSRRLVPAPRPRTTQHQGPDSAPIKFYQ
jgi:hypothetical protein